MDKKIWTFYRDAADIYESIPRFPSNLWRCLQIHCSLLGIKNNLCNPGEILFREAGEGGTAYMSDHTYVPTDHSQFSNLNSHPLHFLMKTSPTNFFPNFTRLSWFKELDDTIHFALHNLAPPFSDIPEFYSPYCW